MEDKVRAYVESLPDPAFIRCQLAGKTVPFERGHIDFKVRSPGKAVIEYQDEDHTAIAWLDLKRNVKAGDVVALAIPEGTFWRVDLR